MLRPYTRLDAPQFDHVRADFDAKLLQQQLANRATGDPRHRLPGARPLEDVARVLAVVFQGAGQVGVSRPRPRDLAPALASPRPRGGVRLPRPPNLPVLPTAVPDPHRAGRAQRFPRADAREAPEL